MTREGFEYRTLTRLKQLEYLIRTQQIDPQFFWKELDRNDSTLVIVHREVGQERAFGERPMGRLVRAQICGSQRPL